MAPLVEILVFLPVGFWLLAKGGDLLVVGSAGAARRLGMSSVAIGLTVVAWATSAPELVASTIAAQQGSPAIALGNVLGSNAANIGLVLAACTLVLPAVLGQRLAPREAFWLLASLGALWLACADAAVTELEALGLLAIFALHNVHLYRTRGGAPPVVPAETTEEAVALRRPWGAVLFGAVAIAVGARLAIVGAEEIARLVGISDRVIGLTVLAVGTSLPELAAGLTAAFKGESGIGLGNVVGSNVFNSLVVLGVVGLLVPLDDAEPELAEALRHSTAVDFPVVLAFSLAAILLPWLAGPRASRALGGLLLAGYATYVLVVLAGG